MPSLDALHVEEDARELLFIAHSHQVIAPLRTRSSRRSDGRAWSGLGSTTDENGDAI